MWKSLKKAFTKKQNPGASTEEHYPDTVQYQLTSGSDEDRRNSTNSASESTATNKIEQPNDPYQKLSELNDDLHALDILSFLSLRILLETRLGRGAHLTMEEMAVLKKYVLDIGDSYKLFSEVVSSCIQYRLISISLKEGEKKQPSEGTITANDKDVKDHIKDEKTDHLNGVTTGLEVKIDVSAVTNEANKTVNTCKTEEGSLKTVDSNELSPVSGDSGSTSTSQIPASNLNPSKSQENLFDVSNDPAVTSLMEKAESHYKNIVELIDKANMVIDDHRRQINPQVLINSQTEAGFIQRFFVRPKYKELVKGCGSGRTHQSYVWAGTEQPGDAWMNELLRCYWREMETYRPEWFELTMRKKKDPTKERKPSLNPSTSTPSTSLDDNPPLSPVPPPDPWEEYEDCEEDEKDVHRKRQMEILSARASNKNILDVVDSLDLIYWAAFARQFPELHSAHTMKVIEDAVEKMGGWLHFDKFCRTWLRQFYIDFGRSTVPYPLPGCHVWEPKIHVPTDGSIVSLPLTVSLKDLNDYMEKEADKKKVHRSSSILGRREKKRSNDMKRAASVIMNNENPKPTDTFVSLLNGPLHQDGRYWDFLCRAICRELLFLHDVMDEEFDSDELNVVKWINSVKSSGLLSDGKYTELDPQEDFYFDETMPPCYRKLLHPNLIRLREKAIIINAYFRNIRYNRLFKMEEEIRDLFELRPRTGSKKHIFRSSNSVSNKSRSGDVDVVNEEPQQQTFKKGHKKAASTGVFDRLLRRRKTTHTKSPKESSSSVNVPYPSSEKEDALSELWKKNMDISSEPDLTHTKRPHTAEETVRPRTRSMPPMPMDAINETASVYEEIRNLCLDVIVRKRLPSVEVAEEAFKLSEVVVKHYLTEELPAKYQSVY